MEKLYDVWARRNPNWEIRYEDSVIKNFCEYRSGTTRLRDARAKLFGAGYEMFIVAFFIGLYFNQRRQLNPDKSKLKVFGQPIQTWGNVDPAKGRKIYPKIRDYIFAALVAKTDFDFIALDKGEKTVREAVDALIDTMEEYANWGFHFVEDKLIDNPNYFYTETAFLELFLTFEADIDFDDEEEPESLIDEEEPKSLKDEGDSINSASESPIEPQIIQKPNTKKKTRWTINETKDLTDYFKVGINIEQLSKVFDREEQNVKDKLHELGLI